MHFRFLLLMFLTVSFGAQALPRDEAMLLQALERGAQGQLVWSRQGRPTPQADELIAVLGAAQDYGLQPEEYGAAMLAAQRDRLVSAPAEATAFDAALSRAALRFVLHLHYGRIDPRAAGFEFHDVRDDLDAPAAVRSMAAAPRVRDAIAAVEPRFHHYQLLKNALARYRTLAADASLTQLPPIRKDAAKKSLREGDAYAGAPALRRLLVALGDMPEVPPPVPDAVYDAALVAGVKHFQDRHGIGTDGALGTKTFAALTTPLAQRVRQMELTLERWRWLPAFTTPPIMVNIPQFRLFIFHTTEDRAADIEQMPVIVGQTYPRTRTPVFVGDMRYVIFRPYWDVPPSITRRELLPDIRKNPGYLQKHNMEIVQGDRDNSPVVAPTPAALEALAAGQLRLRQRPGEDNALGPIKFIFPNEHNVYLHGTPAQHLFAQPRRAFSHGCIRVADPVALAEHVLKNADGEWTRERILSEMNNAGAPLRVNLKRPIRVMVVYGTALATESGPVRFFDDIYGHDRKLETLLGLKPVYSAAAAR